MTMPRRAGHPELRVFTQSLAQDNAVVTSNAADYLTRRWFGFGIDRRRGSVGEYEEAADDRHDVRKDSEEPRIARDHVVELEPAESLSRNAQSCSPPPTRGRFSERASAM